MGTQKRRRRRRRRRRPTRESTHARAKEDARERHSTEMRSATSFGIALSGAIALTLLASVSEAKVDFTKPHEMKMTVPTMSHNDSDASITVVGGYLFDDGNKGGLVTLVDPEKTMTYVIRCGDGDKVVDSLVVHLSSGACKVVKASGKAKESEKVLRTMACMVPSMAESGEAESSENATEGVADTFRSSESDAEAFEKANYVLNGAMTIQSVRQLTQEEAQSP